MNQAIMKSNSYIKKGGETKMNKWKRAMIAGIVLLLASACFSLEAAEASNKEISRGEFIQTLVTELGIDLQTGKELPFVDIDDKLNPYIEAAYRTNIAAGMTASSFAPNEKITREQAYVFLIRALNLRDEYDVGVLTSFTDENSIRDDYKNELAAAAALGLIDTSRPQFQPKAVFADIADVMQLIKSFEETFDIISVIHTNDTHGRVLHNAENKELGFAKIANIINSVRAKNPTFVVDNGDTIHGTNYVIMDKGQALADIYNAIQYDAMAAGNHDFNYGQDQLLALKEQFQFPLISANIMKNGESFLPPYTIIEKGGKTFGFIGLTATDTAVKTHPNGIKGITFDDEVTTAKKVVRELAGKVDEILVLSHSGYETEIKVADQVPEIAVVFGGHSHTTIETPEKRKYGYVTQSYEHGKALGRANLIFHDDKLIGVNGFLYRDSTDKQEDQKIAAVIKPYQEKVDKMMGETVANVNVKLEGNRLYVRTQETNLGNLIADALRYALDTDIALTNGGGIRATIEAGNVKRKDIYAAFPFDNTAVKVVLTGAEIKAALEHSVRLFNPDDIKASENGGFLHVSGLTFTFDPTKPAGGRVQEVVINGAALEADKTYTVATNDFIAAGGDGYEMFSTDKIEFNSNDEYATVLLDYLKAGKEIPVVEDRIKVLR